MATKKPQFSITVDEDMLKEIENFRFEKRYPNRNQAVVKLLELGLEKLKSDTIQHEEK